MGRGEGGGRRERRSGMRFCFGWGGDKEGKGWESVGRVDSLGGGGGVFVGAVGG